MLVALSPSWQRNIREKDMPALKQQNSTRSHFTAARQEVWRELESVRNAAVARGQHGGYEKTKESVVGTREASIESETRRAEDK